MNYNVPFELRVKGQSEFQPEQQALILHPYSHVVQHSCIPDHQFRALVSV